MFKSLHALGGALTLLLASPALTAAPVGEEIELDEVAVFIEYNATDDEHVVGFFWDGDPWKSMVVRGPNGPKAKSKPVLNVKPKANARKQGLVEGFFETEPPDLEETTLEEFFAEFPEGTYTFKGKGLEKGEKLVGETEFSHALPDDPGNVFPDDGDMLDGRAGITVTFDPVTEDLDGDPIDIHFYTVVVEYESPESGEDLVFSMSMDGSVEAPAVTIPPEFLIDGETYTVEIIVQAENGNRTVCELEFDTI